jgi:hypothetical protein
VVSLLAAGPAVTQIVIQFRPELGVTYRDGAFRSSSAEVIQPINDILWRLPDASVEPVFGGAAGDMPSHMRYYFMISLEDEDRARSLERILQQQPSLMAAYVKPGAELP